MNKPFKKLDTETLKDRIEGNKIILNGKGIFPKKLIIYLQSGKPEEYELKKTRNDKFLLN